MKSWNQINKTTRVGKSTFKGVPVLETLNTVYGYYTTVRELSEAEYRELMALPPYDGPVHEAEARPNASQTLVEQ